QRQAQQHGLEIEPVVIPGDENTAFQQQNAEGCEKPRPARAEDQERQNKLDEKNTAAREFQHAWRQLGGGPSQRRGKRLGAKRERRAQRGPTVWNRGLGFGRPPKKKKNGIAASAAARSRAWGRS